MKKTTLLVNLPLLTFGGYAGNSQPLEKTQSPAVKTPPTNTRRKVQDRSEAAPTSRDQFEAANQLEILTHKPVTFREDDMAKGVFCIATTEPQATTIVEQLKTTGFSHNDISVLLPDKTDTRDFAHEQHPKAPEGAGTGTGGVLGGALAWMGGICVLAIPGLGPFIAAGPIMAALSGTGTGAVLGGITGALIGMGIPEYEARRYEGKIKNSNILIFVHARDSTERDMAQAIFEQAGAEDISYTEEAVIAKEAWAWRTKAVRPLPAPPAAPGISLPFSHFPSIQRTWGIDMRYTEEGNVGWILLWVLGVPIPLLVALFLLRGCT